MASLNLRIKTLQGTTLEISIDPSITVGELKNLLVEKSSIPAEQQKLIFMGKVLKDPQTIASYDVKENSVIHLVSNRPQPSPSTPPQTSSETPANDPNATSSTQPNVQNPSNPQGQVPPIQSMRINLNPQDFARMLQIGTQALGGILPPNNQALPNPFGVPLPQPSPQSAQPNATNLPPNGVHMQAPFLNLQNAFRAAQQAQMNMNPQQQSQQLPTQSPAPQPNLPNINVQIQHQHHQGQQQQQQRSNVINSPLDLELDAGVISGDLSKVQSAVQRGANVNRGALHKACTFGHRDIVTFLVQNGANVEVKTLNGETPLHTASYAGQNDIVRYLIEDCTANLYERTAEGMSCLMLAVFGGHRSTTELLLSKGANVHDNDVYGSTALHIASQKGNKEIVTLLVSNGANASIRDSRGRTALHFAAAGGFASIIATLLNYNAPIDAINANKETALHYATFHGHRDCVMYLVSKGANTNLASKSGTPLQLAINKNFHDIVQILQHNNQQN